MLSIPVSEEETCGRLEAAGAMFLHEEPSMPFNSDGTLTIPHTFQELALGNTVDADFVRRNAGVRTRLASALDRAAEAIETMLEDASGVTRWMSVDQLLELLAQLPPDIPVQAEGCGCVNDVKGVGLYRLGPDNRDGPRASS